VHHNRSRRPPRNVAVCSIFVLACAALLVPFAGSSAGAADKLTTRTVVPSSVTSTFPLGVTGLVRNRDGSTTLWVLNAQSKRLVLDGSSIFSIIDVVFSGKPGYVFKLRSGANCSVAANDAGGSSIECLPDIEPHQLLPVATFTSNRPYPLGATSTVELNSSAEVTDAVNVSIPRDAVTDAAIQRYLGDYFRTLHLVSTVEEVTSGEPTENAYVLSPKTVPLGWVTFVVTNRGHKQHSFEVCPTSGLVKGGGLLNQCLASSEGASYADEYDDTGPLLPGQSTFFTMRFSSPGLYEYLSDIVGQPAHGAKADLKVT